MATATAARLTRLLEITTSGTANVDREAGIIRNVKILGTVSKNGRTYSRACLAKARGLYEGCKVNINHPNRSTPMAERGLHEQFGWLQNVRLSDSGLFGDLHYLKSHPDACHVIERAERNPQLIGLSHNAEGRTEMRNGKTMVENIERVHSVDLVTSPASTRGLFEAMDGGDFSGAERPTPLDAANLLKRAREMMIETIRISGTPSDVSEIKRIFKQFLAELSAKVTSIGSASATVDESVRRRWDKQVARAEQRLLERETGTSHVATSSTPAAAKWQAAVARAEQKVGKRRAHLR